jgi:hypothetical protein
MGRAGSRGPSHMTRASILLLRQRPTRRPPEWAATATDAGTEEETETETAVGMAMETEMEMAEVKGTAMEAETVGETATAADTDRSARLQHHAPNQLAQVRSHGIARPLSML